MPISVLSPPGRAVDAATKTVQSLALASGPHFLCDVPREQLELVAPHRVYTLTLRDARDQQLSNASPAGWRFLLVTEDDVVGSVETGMDADHSVTIRADRFATATAEAIEQLEDLSEVQRGEFELRLLKLNSLYLWALWLVGDPELIFPLEPSPAFITAGRLHTEAEFVDAVSKPGVEPFNPPDN